MLYNEYIYLNITKMNLIQNDNFKESTVIRNLKKNHIIKIVILYVK